MPAAADPNEFTKEHLEVKSGASSRGNFGSNPNEFIAEFDARMGSNMTEVTLLQVKDT